MASPKYKFTSYDLDASVDVARVLDVHGGAGSADELAAWLNYANRNSGAFLLRVANARLHGTIEGPSTRIQTSKLALDILRPDFPETEARARLQAFENVPLNRAVLERYQGQTLPSEEGLRNALTVQWEIDPDKSAWVLARLLDSAAQAGLFKAGGRTRMIRPTSFQPPSKSDRPAIQDDQSEIENSQFDVSEPQAGPVAAIASVSANDARKAKLIDGALDMLPPLSNDASVSNWTEAELTQWLSFFESGLRVVYHLPKSVRPATGSP